MNEVTLLKEYIAHLESALESSLALNKAQANRKWVQLTKEEFDFIYSQHDEYDEFAQAIEAKLREKNAYTTVEKR